VNGLSDCKQVRLSADTKIKTFNCGDDDLNEFLFKDALSYLAELYAVTYLYEYGADTVAFFSVSNDKITYDKESISESEWRRLCKPIPFVKRRRNGNPAVKIGRLGVNTKYQKKGIGTELLSYIKMFFLDNNKTGCRFITLDAYNNSEALSFYEKNEFKFLTEHDKDQTTRSMYFDLKPFALRSLVK
jgi:GNAT superfamily N-acetyltransferase